MKVMSATQNRGQASLTREISLAVRNAVKLMASFGVTLAVAFVVRFWIPRFLGPEAFGILHFSEQFAMTMFFIVTFGTDVYIRKEVASRPDHASEFFGGLLLFRLGLSAVIAIVIAAALFMMDKDPMVWHLAYAFSLGQMLFVMNTSLGAILEARGTIGELATVNAVVKIIWGAGCVGGLLLGMGPMAVAISFLFGETLKVPVLFSAARKHVGLKMRFSLEGTKMIIIASLPYCINYVALGVYNKIGVTLLSALTNDQEVGWYGAAVNITFIIFLFIPILRAIVMPMGARLAQESTELLNKTLLITARVMMMITVPMAALLALNAQPVIGQIYTESYYPSVRTLQISTPLIPLTFLCSISATYLIQLGHIWRLAKISVVALVFNIVLNASLIQSAHQFFGDGGGGIAASLSVVATECLVASLFFRQLRKTVTTGGRQFAWLLLRLFVVCGIVGAIHSFVASLGLWCILIDTAAYCVLGLLFGVLPIRDFIAALKSYRDKG